MSSANAAACLLIGSLSALAQAPCANGSPASSAPPAAAVPADRHGQHDFDFELGTWEIHLQRRVNPLTGSNQWVRFDGTSVTRRVWDGRAQIEQFETDGAGGRIEGLTLRLYNPDTHQWNLYWANSKDGLVVPVQVGQFRDGRGEFYGYDTLNGRPILIRFAWSKTDTDSPHFEQSFSQDGGQSWEVNWITDQRHVAAASLNPHPAPPPAQAGSNGAAHALPGRDGQHDFDPLIGRWTYRLKRRLHPLTGSNTWVDFKGTSDCVGVWDGRADLEQVEFDAPSGHIEGLTLRLYDPQTRQWRLYWANSRDGILAPPPQVGEFKDGRGDFYASDTLGGRSILVRYAWSDMATQSPHFEESFSSDGGKSWEVNWITDQTRVGSTR